jgi:outer membrane lipoprotein-sorting protein
MITRVWIALGLLFFTYPSQAAQLPLDELIDRIQEAYNLAEDLDADFTQEAYNKAVGRTQKAEGKVYVKKPNLMRWDYRPTLCAGITGHPTFSTLSLMEKHSGGILRKIIKL